MLRCTLAALVCFTAATAAHAQSTPAPTPAPAPPLTPEQRTIAEVTSADPASFADATYIPLPAPGARTQTKCTVRFRVARAGTMAPIPSGFQVAVDLTVDPHNLPSYNIAMDDDSKATFAGGGLKEQTGELHNGVLHIADPPAQFEIDTEWGSGGSGHALIYRQCFGAQTMLIFVVNDPADLSKGGTWLWVKSGKYTALPK